MPVCGRASRPPDKPGAAAARPRGREVRRLVRAGRRWRYHQWPTCLSVNFCLFLQVAVRIPKGAAGFSRALFHPCGLPTGECIRERQHLFIDGRPCLGSVEPCGAMASRERASRRTSAARVLRFPHPGQPRARGKGRQPWPRVWIRRETAEGAADDGPGEAWASGRCSGCGHGRPCRDLAAAGNRCVGRPVRSAV
jgi:hypothetical protein